MMNRSPGLAALLILSPLANAGEETVIPSLRVSRQPGSSLTISWDTQEAYQYQVEHRPSLREGTWNPIGQPALGTGSEMSFSNEMVGSSMFYRLQVIPPQPELLRVAVMGDSITEQGSSNLNHIWSTGYWGWARALGGSRWDLVPNGSTLRFATGGKRSDEVSALHLPQVLASDADVCVLAYGTNDAFQLQPVQHIVNQAISDWAALRAAGIEPIATTILPMGSVGGGMAARQARIAEMNTALRVACSSNNVTLCDWTTLLEAVPGSNNGVAVDSYFVNSDNLHPMAYGASLMGRELHKTLSSKFRFGKDVFENTAWLTPNTGFAGTAGQAATWAKYPPSGASFASQSLIPSEEGNWWQLGISATESGHYNIVNFSSNLGGQVAGKTVESVAEIRVVSGSLNSVLLQTSYGTVVSSDLSSGQRTGPQVTPQDGIVVLRTPPVTLGQGATTVMPALYFNTGEPDTVLQIRRCGVREIQ
jgi:lysophospholipase L1-like esterase